jgi:hypothetical protein
MSIIFATGALRLLVTGNWQPATKPHVYSKLNVTILTTGALHLTGDWQLATGNETSSLFEVNR